MSLPLLIVGAGGHGAVLADALLAAGEQVLGFTDADPACHGRERCGLRVLGNDEAVLAAHDVDTVLLVNGIGGTGRRDDTLRRRVQEVLQARNWRFAGVRHPTATVSRFARIAPDAQLLAGAIVQAGAEVGEGAIVNTAAVVEHDAVVGAFSHIAPRALLCGEVRVGAGCHVGAGAVVRQGVRLGAGTVVGAGAVVVRDSEAGALLVGVPAVRRERSP